MANKPFCVAWEAGFLLLPRARESVGQLLSRESRRNLQDTWAYHHMGNKICITPEARNILWGGNMEGTHVSSFV